MRDTVSRSTEQVEQVGQADQAVQAKQAQQSEQRRPTSPTTSGHIDKEASPVPSAATPFRGTTAVLRALEADLRQHTRGEVRFDQGSKALYASDASNYRQVPLAVVVPADVDDLFATLAACRRNDVPFLARGGGTSQNGQCVNVAVVADASKYVNRVVEIDPVARTAIVEPGVVCDTL